MHPDPITGKSVCIEAGGGGEEGRFGGESGKFCPWVSSVSRRGEEILVEGISAANKMIQREELGESTLPEKRATAERAAARQCLPPGRASGRLREGCSGGESPGPGGGCGAGRGWGGKARRAARRSQPGLSPRLARIVTGWELRAAARPPSARRSEDLFSVLFGGTAC